MSVLESAEELLARMSRAEKAQLLQWAARDLGDEITRQIEENEAGTRTQFATVLTGATLAT